MLNTRLRVGITESVKQEQRLKRDAVVSKAAIWGKSNGSEGTSRAYNYNVVV